MKKYAQYFSIIVLSLFFNEAWSCSLNRISNYSQMFSYLDDIIISDFDIEKDKLISEIAKLHDEAKLLPLSADLTEQLAHETTIGSFHSNDRSESTELTISYDLNFKKRNIQSSLINEKKKLLFSNLQINENKHTSSKINAAIDVLESIELDKIFLKKAVVLSEQFEYYESLRKSGVLKTNEISDIANKLQSNKDKIIANSVKKDDKLFYLTLSSSDFTVFPPIERQILTPITSACIFSAETIKKQKTELKILRVQQKLEAMSSRSKFSFDLGVSQTSTETNYSDEASISLSMKLPLFDGGSSATEKKHLERTIRNKEKNLQRSEQNLIDLFNRRKKTEEVFLLSINTLEKQVYELEERVNELALRKSMGQSVFLEYSNKKLERLEIKEALLRLKADFIVGWMDFLEQVNGFKSS